MVTLRGRPVVVPLLCALAAVALLLVAIENVSTKRSELMQFIPSGQIQLFDLDPEELGPEIYSKGAEMAREHLQASIAAEKAKRRAIQQKQLEDAIQAEIEHAARMMDACDKNPGIPGCPYKPKQIVWNNVGVDPNSVGPEYYNVVSEQARGELEANRAAEQNAVREHNYQVDVERYQNELMNAIRMKDACAQNPALPGCPAEGGEYIIDVDPPAYAPEHDGTAYVYQNIADERRNALQDDKAEAEADIAYRNKKIAENMAADIAAAEQRLQRWRKGCEDGTSAGCY